MAESPSGVGRVPDDQHALIESHLPLVEHIVYQVAVRFPRHVDREELGRAGVVGLVEAAQRYDEARGIPFARFAAQRIRGAILDAVRQADWAPRSVRTAARSIEHVEQRIAAETRRSPSPEDVASALGITPGELHAIQDRIRRAVVLTLDTAVLEDDEDDLSLVDVVCDHTAEEPWEVLEGRELRSFVRDALALLPERHRLVVEGYFLEGRTSEDIAQALGVTLSRVSQLRSDALALMREAIEAQYDLGPAAGAADRDGPTTVGDSGAVPAPAPGRAARRRAAYAAAVAARSTWRTRIDLTERSVDAECRRTMHLA